MEFVVYYSLMTQFHVHVDSSLGHTFFVSRLLGPRVCGREEKKKRKKKHTEHERVQFLVPLNTRGGLTRPPHGSKHTLNTRGCSFEYH